MLTIHRVYKVCLAHHAADIDRSTPKSSISGDLPCNTADEEALDDEVENVDPDGMMITPNKGGHMHSQPQDMETDGMMIG